MKNFLKVLCETVGLALKFAICSFLLFVMLYASTPRTIQHEDASLDVTEVMQ